MTMVLIILIGAAGIISAFIYFGSRRRDEFTHIGTRLDEFSRALYAITQQVDTRLREASDSAERSQHRAAEALTRVSGHLGEQREMFQRVAEVQRDLKRFQDLLQPPKARGGIGERLLEQILADLLPQGSEVGQYQAQYAFKSGERVDFVIRLRDFLVPIDAKFPIEAFERMHAASGEEEHIRAAREFRQVVKQHVDAVAKKYIRPSEGTSDFAFLYIPSEAVYAGVVDDPEAQDYAFDQRVILVSPGTLFAYLRTVLIGLRGFAIESSAKELLASLGKLEGDVAEFTERFRLLGVHLRNASKAYEEGERQLTKLSDSLERWQEGSAASSSHDKIEGP